MQKQLLDSKGHAEWPVYLSVDLDFWMYLRSSPATFLERALAAVPTSAVVSEHHKLLPHINWAHRTFGVRHMINVDTHSDFPSRGCTGHGWSDSAVLQLDEGTWAEYVSWRAVGHFEWRRPRVKGGLQYGDCTGDSCDPFRFGHHSWQSCNRDIGLARLPWSRIVAVGIALSPAWIRLADTKQRSEIFRIARLLQRTKATEHIARVRCIPHVNLKSVATP